MEFPLPLYSKGLVYEEKSEEFYNFEIVPSREEIIFKGVKIYTF